MPGKQPSNRKKRANHEKPPVASFSCLARLESRRPRLQRCLREFEMTRCFRILGTFPTILVGFNGSRGIEQFHQTRFIGITHWRFAILLDPVGMLDPQVVVNLLQQVRVSADFLGHSHIDSVEDQVCRGTVLPKPRRNSRPAAAPWSTRQQYPKGERPCSGANSIALRCWRCNNTASSPLCVRVGIEVIT